MLIELFGKNFGCFRDEFRLSLEATDIDPGDPRGFVTVNVDGDEPLKLLRAAAIYGPNASGKSTVLQAANTMRYLLESTARFRSDQAIPYFPFLLDSRFRETPISLGVRAVIEGKAYEYSFSYNRTEIVEETLARLDSKGKTTSFERRGQAVDGPWTQKASFKLLAGSAFRKNALLLSLADSLAPELAERVAVGIRELLRFYNQPVSFATFWYDESDPVAERAATDPSFAEWLRARITNVDIGVIGYESKPREGTRHSRSSEEDEPTRPKSYRLQLFHQSKDGPYPLPESRESFGTRRFLDLAPFFFDLTNRLTRRSVFIDELDSSLHPTLLDRLVRHFNCELDADSIHGQLIFATHETSLMDESAKNAILRRDQLYFTEKDSDGAARLYSAAEFNERNNVNVRKRYLQGRYGALPILGEFADGSVLFREGPK